MTSARAPGFIAALRAGCRGRVTDGEPLGRFSTYRIGGPGTVFAPADPDDLAAGLRQAAAHGVAVFPLGLGSNVLLPDAGLEALVVRLGKGLDGVASEGPRWRLGAGLPAPLAARRTVEAGWRGLQVMVGVPGTVGGGVYMNAGCHGGDWAAVVRRVMVMDRAGESGERTAGEVPFAYRSSGLGPLLVVGVEVELVEDDPAQLGDEMKRLFAWREAGTPFNQPCCGSVFKNPVWPGDPPGPALRTAGQLIEACGYKGLREGAVEVSPMHANYFVNLGGGTADQVRRLMDRVRVGVQERFAVALEPEVKVIGTSGAWLAPGEGA